MKTSAYIFPSLLSLGLCHMSLYSSPPNPWPLSLHDTSRPHPEGPPPRLHFRAQSIDIISCTREP